MLVRCLSTLSLVLLTTSSAMSWLGGLGAAVGAALGFAGQEQANSAQIELMKQQQAFQEKVLKKG